MITYEDIIEANKRIRDYIYHTPLEQSIHLSQGKEVYLKLENQQRLKCAKIRGALSKLTSLSPEEKSKGIVAISSGNHGLAVSYACKILGLEAPTIYVPETTPRSKVEKIEFYGGRVEKLGKNYDEAHEMGMKKVKEGSRVFIDPCSDEIVIAGQGSIAIEMLEERPDLDIILVPIGGGGIITGISILAKAIKKDIRIIGVQTKACPAMVAALRDNIYYESYPTEESICDALVGGVGYIPYKMGRSTIDDIIVVEEEYIRLALGHMVKKEKTIAEPAGVVGVAALLKDGDLFKNKKIGLVVTGGNIDEELLVELIKS